MNPIKDDITKASKEIGLTDSQAGNFWQALQEIQKNKSRFDFSTALLYFGACTTCLSMTWFYTTNFKSRYCLLLSIVYALIFFGGGSYFWHVKKLKVPGGLLSTLGITMIPLIVYYLEKMMGWLPRPPLNHYPAFYHWINGNWVPMEICTLTVSCLVLYFIRFPVITVPIYFILTFLCMDASHLLAGPDVDHWPYYSIAFITMGTFLNVLGFALCRKDQKEFGFWSYLFGMFLCSSWLTSRDIETEWGYFAYFLINFAFILLSSFFHRKIFMFFGFLGVIFYIGHLAYIFSNSLMFSYVLGAIGFSIIMLATFLMSPRKIAKISE